MGRSASSVLAVAVMAALVAGVSCDVPNVPPGPNITTDYDGKWLTAVATWYGKPNGAGPDDNGGACGIKQVNLPPYSGMTSCGNVPIFKDGKGCGSCFEIKCEKHPACSKNTGRVFITDMNYDPIAAYHLDLSGTAFGSMAVPGKEDKLRSAGLIELQFRRVRFKFSPETKIVFHVEKFSNPNYLAVLVKFVAEDGDIVQMHLKDKRWPDWKPMKESWGAIWRMDSYEALRGPFSIRLTSESGKQVIARDVIPANWRNETFYKSDVQF